MTSALPAGGQVSAGQAAISSSATQTTVNQSSQRAVINWNSFNIGQNEKVQFNDPNAQAITLNRVLGVNASLINGLVTSNGNVWLINPGGVLFGKNAQINVGGLLASTSAITDKDFMAGSYRFTAGGNPSATVVNEGSITVADAGLAALVAPGVTNSGTIQAKLGRVEMASGDSYTLDLYGDGLINLAASPAVTSQLVANHGSIIADGGTVSLTAATASNVVSSLINMDGLIEADSVGAAAGKVTLSGSTKTDMSGTISAEGGSVETSGEVLSVSGSVTAKNWLLDPNNIIIQSTGSDTNVTGNPNFTTTDDSAIVTTGSIDAALNNGTSVTIATSSNGTNSQNGDIEVASNIEKTAGGDASLTLEAYRNITIDGGVQIASTSGKLNVTLDANDANAGNGAISMTAASGISSNGGSIFLGGGTNPLTGSAVAPNGYGIDLESATLQAGGGNITLNGTSLNNTSNLAAGVFVNSSMIETNGTGRISITGTGGDTAGNMSSIAASEGILLQSSTIDSTAGAITLSGTGGNSGPSGTAGIEQIFGSISSDTGVISLTGQGGNNNGGSYGILLTQGALESTGTSDGARITLNGIGSNNGTNQSIGVYLEHESLSSVSGGISITGQGATSSALDTGVLLTENSGNNSIQSTGTGVDAATITVDGTGANGVSIEGSTISSVDGAIAIAGHGTGTGNTAILLDGSTQLSTSGRAGITFTGNTASDATGIEAVGNGNVTNLINSSKGDVKFVSDSIDFGQNIDSPALADNLQISGGGSITFAPLIPSATITFAPDMNGRYLVYANSASINTFDGLPFDFTLFNCVYNGACPSIPATGNGLLYSGAVPYLPTSEQNPLVNSIVSVDSKLDTVLQTILLLTPSASESFKYISEDSTLPVTPPAPIYIDASLLQNLGLNGDDPNAWWSGTLTDHQHTH